MRRVDINLIRKYHVCCCVCAVSLFVGGFFLFKFVNFLFSTYHCPVFFFLTAVALCLFRWACCECMLWCTTASAVFFDRCVSFYSSALFYRLFPSPTGSLPVNAIYLSISVCRIFVASYYDLLYYLVSLTSFCDGLFQR